MNKQLSGLPVPATPKKQEHLPQRNLESADGQTPARTRHAEAAWPLPWELRAERARLRFQLAAQRHARRQASLHGLTPHSAPGLQQP